MLRQSITTWLFGLVCLAVLVVAIAACGDTLPENCGRTDDGEVVCQNDDDDGGSNFRSDDDEDDD